MSRLIVEPGGALRGRVGVPGDKSISHRALLLGAIAGGRSRVEGFLRASDCLATLRCLRALGVEVEERSPTTLIVGGRGLHGLQEPEDVLDCARSGTTMRLLAGMLAGQPFTSLLTADAQLRRRPMGRITEPLRRMGATVLGRGDGRWPPLALHGGHLRGIDYDLPVASAQLKSALLLAGLYADGPTTLRVPGPARDHTERMLRAMGAEVRLRDWTVEIEPGGELQALDVVVPGDLSSAAFLVVAATLLAGSELTIEGTGVNPTRTGLLDVLGEMGADIAPHHERSVSGEPVADLTVRASELHGVEVRGTIVVRAIDELPILAVAATQAHGETVLRDAAELRVKETDRIATTVQELRRLGAEIEPRPDGFVVHGPTPLHSPVEKGAAVDSHSDHRLAMALAVAGLVARDPIVVQHTECIADSFPGFKCTLRELGQQIEEAGGS
jgi:3-phosphoshikimate 1-carboxyvinyltransferase